MLDAVLGSKEVLPVIMRQLSFELRRNDSFKILNVQQSFLQTVMHVR